VEPSQRDIEKGTDHVGVELGPRAAGEFRPGRLEREGTLVGPDRRHHLEGVGHRDDAGGQGQLVAGESGRVAGPVVVLVVAPDGVDTGAQEGAERLDESGTGFGVALQDLPFALGGLARLVQDLGRNDELPDVVEEGTPADLVGLGRGEVELLDDEVGQGPGPFAVAPCPAIVGVEGRGQGDDLLGQDGDVFGLAGLADPLLELADAGGAQRHREARGGPVREDEVQAEEGGQGEEPAGQAFDQKKGQNRDGRRQDDADDGHGQAGARDRPADQETDDPGHGQRAEKDDQPEDQGGDAAAAPLRGVAPGEGLGDFGHR
jgi:hypothetical protein